MSDLSFNGTNYAPESSADGFTAEVRGKSFCRGELQGFKTDREKKGVGNRTETSHPGDSFSSLVVSKPRRVEVSACISARQEFMSFIFREPIQVTPRPIKRLQ